MKYKIILLVLISGILFSSLAGIKPVKLKCEYLTNPLGMDVSHPTLSWILIESDSTVRGQKQTAYQVIVSTSKSKLLNNNGDLWNSGKVNSDKSVLVAYAGKKLKSEMECYWKVRIWDKDGNVSAWSEPAFWTMGLLKSSDWQASWIGTPKLSSPLFRKTFTINKTVVKGTVYYSSLGYNELYLNGKKVGKQVLSPAVSDYRKRALYITSDVTNLLQSGKNCLGLWLGSGWSKWKKYKLKHGPLAIVQLEIEFSDGTKKIIASGKDWKTHKSPIEILGSWSYANFGGERYNANLEIPGWSSANSNDSNWIYAKEYNPQIEYLSSQIVEPDMIVDTIQAVSVSEISWHHYLLTMQKNFTGWFQIKMRGDKGDTVRFKYFDIYPPSSRYQEDYNQYDEYIFKGKSEVEFRNRFNYHAFRWVVISGLKTKPSIKDIKGFLIRSNYNNTGEFTCSNKLLNGIYKTVRWTYQCLTLGGYFVDSPHRERRGYGADGQANVEQAIYNFSQRAFFTKWLQDWSDIRDTITGLIPDTAPTLSSSDEPAWGGIGVTLPWNLYLQYGDKRILKKCYPMIKGYIRFLQSKSEHYLLQPYGKAKGVWRFLGDWVAPGRDQDIGEWSPFKLRYCFNNFYMLYLIKIGHRVASLLGDNKTKKSYEVYEAKMAKAINKEFFYKKKAQYVNGEQPYQVFPLMLNIVSQRYKQKVIDNLQREIIVKNHGHIFAGMLGTYFLLKGLTDLGRGDLIYLIANQKSYPGWGYMLEKGATTFWERWNGIYSHIHSTFLSIGSWFYRGLAGIRIDKNHPGFKHYFIKPSVTGDLQYAAGKYNSIHGKIISKWHIEDEFIKLKETIPVNTTATLYLPTSEPRLVKEEGQLISGNKISGIKLDSIISGYAIYDLQSGQYSFTAPFDSSLRLTISESAYVYAPRIVPVDTSIVNQKKLLVKITSSTPNSEIYFTLNGKTPNKNSVKYSKPFYIDSTTIIEAKAFKKGKYSSSITKSDIAFIDPKVSGAHYYYYKGIWNNLPKFSELKPVKEGWTKQLNLKDIKTRQNHFAVKFKSYLKIPEKGDYKFYLKSDDGSKLLIDGKTIIDNDGSHGALEKNTTLKLNTGLHKIEVLYFQDYARKVLKVSISKNGLNKQEIPVKDFFLHNQDKQN